MKAALPPEIQKVSYLELSHWQLVLMPLTLSYHPPTYDCPSSEHKTMIFALIIHTHSFHYC